MSVKAHELTEHPEFWAAEINKMNSEIDRLRARLAEIEGQKPDYYARKEEGVDIVSRHGRAMITLATEPDKYMCIPLYAAPVPAIPEGWKLVVVEPIMRAIHALERFANDTLAGRNSAHELRELLAAPQPEDKDYQSTLTD